MNELQTTTQKFTYGDLQVRTTMINGEPWFVAKDVIQVLGMSVSSVSNIMKPLDVDMHCKKKVLTVQGPVFMIHVNEAGVNMLIMRSNKPEAVRFQRWLASEVLPSIRRHGMYMTPEVAKESQDDQESFLARAVLVAQEVIAKKDAVIAEQAQQIAVLEPKAKQYDKVMSAEQTYTVTDIAEMNGWNNQRLFKVLRAHGWLLKVGRGPNHVGKQAPEGVFRVIKTVYGEQVRVTLHGQKEIERLINLVNLHEI